MRIKATNPRQSNPSATAEQLHRVPAEEALAFVDDKLGKHGEWPSPLIAYRLTSDFQSDWKCEVGQWLKTAEHFGFLERVLHDVTKQAKRRSKKHTGEIDPNDPKHLKLHEHLAAARIVHYRTATGWGFVGYETETGGAVDIDCVLSAPGGVSVEFQVKAPDRPGRIQNHRVVDGHQDDRVVVALDHATQQLRAPPTGPALIGFCANRDWSLAYRPGLLVRSLFGTTTQVQRRVSLDAALSGRFFRAEWSHVSGVLVLDLIRGEIDALYTCTVLTNPNASFPVEPSWFPFARVCLLDGDTFRWVRGAPRDTGLSDVPNSNLMGPPTKQGHGARGKA